MTNMKKLLIAVALLFFPLSLSFIVGDVMREKLLNMLIKEEGERLTAYRDHLGYLTIGVGRLIDEKASGGITKEESRYLLNNDVDRILNVLTKEISFWDSLTDARKAVLVGMAFQMGVNGLFQFKNTLAAIKEGNYSKAADNMLTSKWATQTPERARRMALMMETGEWNAA